MRERAYRVTIAHELYATSAKEAARQTRRDLLKGCSHYIFEVTDLNAGRTITRDLSDDLDRDGGEPK